MEVERKEKWKLDVGKTENERSLNALVAKYSMAFPKTLDKQFDAVILYSLYEVYELPSKISPCIGLERNQRKVFFAALIWYFHYKKRNLASRLKTDIGGISVYDYPRSAICS